MGVTQLDEQIELQVVVIPGIVRGPGWTNATRADFGRSVVVRVKNEVPQ